MPSEDRLTVPVELLRPLLRALADRGVAVEEALDCPGGRIDAATLPRGGAMLDRDDFVHAFGASTCLLEQALCEPRAKTAARRKAFELFFDFTVAASDLREVCGRAAQFNALMEERGYTLALTVEGDEARFAIDFNPSIPDCPPALVAAAMVFFYNVFSWMTGARIDLRHIGLMAGRPRKSDPCLALLASDIRYRRPQNYLAFGAVDLDRKVVRSARDFEGIVDYIAYDPLLLFRTAMPTAARVRSVLLDSAGAGERVPDSRAVADRLGISVSTLSRRLRQERTLFLQLKSECRQEVAKRLLRQGALSVHEIAPKLGFADARSFRRAFIGWTGVLPSVFRATAMRG